VVPFATLNSIRSSTSPDAEDELFSPAPLSNTFDGADDVGLTDIKLKCPTLAYQAVADR
jgi:hypothetical protein